MNWRTYKFAMLKFLSDQGSLHASALTFYTLFAVVPILATAFGIAKGFGLEGFLNIQLERLFPGQEAVVTTLGEYAQNLLAHSSGGVIAGVGLVVLLYSVFSMMNHIEGTLNQIWQVPSPRSINLRVNHYLSLMLTAPIILILTGSVKLYLAQQVANYSLALSIGSRLISFLLIVLFFTWLFEYIPNTKVKRKTAFFGGIQTGIAYSIVQTILVESQMLVSNFGAVYGSLAAFPIFLIWIQTSWVIVLYGAQLCFVYQNKIQQTWQLDVSQLSVNKRQELMLAITDACVAQFKANEPPLTTDEVATAVKIPNCCAQQLLLQLVSAEVLVETRTGKHFQHGYLPAKNAELLDPNSVINAINNCSRDPG
jgi:membrane protein